jgi:hypothetical protein
MTSIHDCMLAVYRGQTPERIPVGIYERYLPRGGLEREVRGLGLGIVDYYPVVTMLAPPWHMYPGYVSEVRGADFRVDYAWERGVLVERRTYTTPVGTVWQEITSDPGGVGSESMRKYYISRPEDYLVVQYLVEHTVIRRNEDSIVSKIRELGTDGVVFGRLDRSPYQKCLIELAGAERFLVDLHTDPAPAEGLLEALFTRHEEAWQMALESQVEVLWQPDNVTSLMTPPSAFRKYCMPFYQQRARQARKAGKPFVVHMDGKIGALATDIRASGVHVVESFSLPAIGGDMTLTKARAALPETVIVPNFPSNWCMHTDADIKANIRDLLEEAGRNTAFMIHVSEDLPTNQWERIVPLLVQTVAGHATSRP